ncbi:MAG: GNAT family N-acetyltransferase [Bryobacterales bacterium]|nr:GNAT family N-acetyltransferase [Bryobacterales bacterium]
MSVNLTLRAAKRADRSEIADLICASLNCWYVAHGGSAIFPGGPADADVFFDVYDALEPGNCVVAENASNGRLAGSCFYHPRPAHVSLGVMNVHPDYFGQGIARSLLQFIIDFTDKGGYPALRLISSAGNLDSFSLYNRAGFFPRAVYQDMVLDVPADGLKHTAPGMNRIREAAEADAPRMAALERAVSGVERGGDYAFCIRNQNGFWRASVYETEAGAVAGYMIASTHRALNILGPAVAVSDEAMAALLLHELDRHRGRTPLFILPCDHPQLVRQAYTWGARNVELHVCQVRGTFQPFQGVVLPTFLLETA